MVGFGSSLRMARRAGWEDSYLNYEALKLLLTQIEAVYEEEAHLQQQREGFGGDGDGIESSSRPGKARDYRDDLFLESDSDAAFESLMKCDYYSATEDNSDLEQQQQQQQQQQHLEMEQQNNRSDSMINNIFSESDENRRRQGKTTGGSTTGSALPFSLSSYSHDPTAPFASEYGNYTEGVYTNEDDDDDDEDDINANCVPITSAWGKSKFKQKKQKTKDAQNRNPRHRQSNSFLSPGTGELNEFFVKTNPNQNTADAFILDASTQDTSGLTSFSQVFENPSSSSILKKPFRRTTSANEKTSLLQVPSTPADYSSSLYSFASQTGTVTSPQTDGFSNYQFHHPHPHNQIHTQDNNPNPNLQMPVFTSSVANPRDTKAQQEKLVAQRKEERRQRRKKKRERAKNRKALEQKVPPHIRLAHSKARDITERFLGLLRAECEKVMLFTQSRLGELSDTVGSLRFPNMEDNDNYNNNNHRHQQAVVDAVPLSPSSNAALSYEGYPLSDGGMHPSASSSSDDGAAGGSGTFYWSDSSTNDSVKSQNSNGSHERLSAMKDLHVRDKKEVPVENLKDRGEHRRDDSFSKRKRKHDGFDSAKRHLDHFEKLRRSRPIFQRNGNIVGEDLLLLSAVDEADGYTAVGVELMHVLRFICVNLVALRKICRKHDRLLANRMLGLYYHYIKMSAATAPNKKVKSGGKTPQMPKPSNQEPSFTDEHVQNAQTLGGLLARESGDILESHHPAVIGQGLNNYKLAGLYDSNLQQLANSRTVQVISSCLVLALSEYEVSRSRANALVTLNTTGSGNAPRRDHGSRFGINGQQQQQQDQMSVLTGFDNQPGMEILDEKDEYDSDAERGAPSTASSISLTRLRFTVTSIIAMREAARQKHNMYATYLSRSMLAFTGRAVLGEGLDGCSRETLDFLVSYNPDAALLMDPATLNVGLKQGMWSNRAISSVMASSLAIATTPVEHTYEASSTKLDKQGKAVMDALNLLPKATFLEVPELFKGQLAKKVKVTKLENEAFRSVLRLNRMSHLLYNMNYYVVHPTTITFVQAVASPAAHSALIIGAPSVSAILAALLHCYVLSGDSKAPLKSFKSLRWLFVIAALFGFMGNGVHVYGIWQNSVPLSVLGRFVLGLSSTEILHRHIVASCLPMPPPVIVSETATLIQAQVVGMLLGLLVGTLAEYLPYHITGWGVKSLSSSSWLMAVLWFIQLVFLCFQFTVNRLVSSETMNARNSAEVEQLLTSSKATVCRPGHDSDFAHAKGGELLSQTASLRLTYGDTTEGEIPSDVAMDTSKDSNSGGKKKRGRGRGRKRRMRTLKSFPSRFHRLFTYSIAVPVCILTILFIKFAQEVLFSSCPMILDRYFRWGGGRAGIFLACLALTIPIINFVCGQIARKYEERTVIKRAVVILAIGLFAMINFGSIISLAFQVNELLAEAAEGRHERTYDWLLGLVQYFAGMSVAFLGLTAIDSASLSLLSKVAPPRIRSSSVALQLGTIVSFVGMVARVLANLQVLMVGLSHRLINTDLVNSLVIPLFFVCFIIVHFVRKHFFFLM